MAQLSDIEIAQRCQMKPIVEIAAKAGIDEKHLSQYGRYKAKVDPVLLKETERQDGKLILVTAITPTPAGEGKTTTTIGLADGLTRIGKNAVGVLLRRPPPEVCRGSDSLRQRKQRRKRADRQPGHVGTHRTASTEFP